MLIVPRLQCAEVECNTVLDDLQRRCEVDRPIVARNQRGRIAAGLISASGISSKLVGMMG